jgi:LysR family transcriptional regulator, glycine cleavage system transcriptional activator
MIEPRLPPLPALRSFEAAARLESFSRAADELHVTHGAVSHQVRALEEFLGARLFARNGRRVALTADGRVFADRVRAALRDIGEAANSLRRPGRANRLTVSLVPSFAARWLMPRLGRFMAAHPDITVNVHASLALVDFERDEIDLAIRFGSGDWPRVEAEKFMDDEYFPVASPGFNRGRLPSRPVELAQFRLMTSDDEPWTPWFKAAGVKLAEPEGPIFSDSSMVVQAAIDGRGIALVRRSITEGALAAGSLVRLFEIAIPAPGSYYLVRPKGPAPQKVLAFRAWMLEEKKRKR